MLYKLSLFTIFYIIVGPQSSYLSKQPNAGSAKKQVAKADLPTRFALVEVEVKDMDTGRKMCVLKRVPTTTTVGELKKLFEKEYPSFYPERQAFFLDKKSPGIESKTTAKLETKYMLRFFLNLNYLLMLAF